MKTIRPRSPGFTLLELLVVIALIAAIAGVIGGSLGGGNQATALQAAQASVANLLAVARTRAMAGGFHTRVLVQHDGQSQLAASRYLRFLALEQQQADGSWQTLQTITLAAGIYVLPHQNQTPANLLAGPAWVKADGARLHSSCLFQPGLSRAVNATTVESWVPLVFTPQGTTATSGFLALATGRRLPPAVVMAGDPPIVLENREAVRGLQLSAYGLAVLINERSSF